MIINILIAYGAFQAFFISFILLRPENKTLFKKLFALLLMIEGTTLFERLLVETELILTVPHLLGISYPISFLKPPLMLFMALAMTDSSFKIQRNNYLHLIPFGLMFLLNLPFYFMSGTEKIAQVRVFMEKVPSYQSFEFYFSLSFFVYIGIYIYFSLKKLNRFRQQVINNALVNWYRLILLAYAGFLVLHLLYFLLQPMAQLNFALVNQISMLVMTFIVQSIAFKLIDKSIILNTKTPELGNLQKRMEHENLIIRQLEEEKAFLNDDLNLQKFSESISLSPSCVSTIINQRFNCSFKKLISRYRIEEAKDLMNNSDNAKIKLIDIAYRVGFNNKVSFYRAFKEFENISPSAYLQKIKIQEN